MGSGISGRLVNFDDATVDQELIAQPRALTIEFWNFRSPCLRGRTPGAFIINHISEAIHGYSIGAAAAQGPVPAGPGKFPDYPDGARQADRRAHFLLD